MNKSIGDFYLQFPANFNDQICAKVITAPEMSNIHDYEIEIDFVMIPSMAKGKLSIWLWDIRDEYEVGEQIIVDYVNDKWVYVEGK